MKILELHYPMIQFLIINNISIMPLMSYFSLVDRVYRQKRAFFTAFELKNRAVA